MKQKSLWLVELAIVVIVLLVIGLATAPQISLAGP